MNSTRVSTAKHIAQNLLREFVHSTLASDIEAGPPTEPISVPANHVVLWPDDVQKKFPEAWRAWLGAWSDAVARSNFAEHLTYYATESKFYEVEGSLYAIVTKESDAIHPAGTTPASSAPEHRSHERPEITLEWDERRRFWLSDTFVSPSFHTAARDAVAEPEIDPDMFDAERSAPTIESDKEKESEVGRPLGMREFEGEFPGALDALDAHLTGVWEDHGDRLMSSEFYAWRGLGVIWSPNLDNGEGLVAWDPHSESFTDTNLMTGDKLSRTWLGDNPGWARAHGLPDHPDS